MSNTTQFQKVPITVQNRNGIDCSCERIGTAQPGTLIPVLIDEIFPNDKFNLGVTAEVELPPMATNFYGRVDLSFEAFFVPYRIVYGGWKKFYTQKNGDGLLLPTATLFYGSDCKPTKLYDYFGIRLPGTFQDNTSFEGVNIFPALAYAKIYDDWYRDSRLSKPLFVDDDNANPAQLIPYKNYFDEIFARGASAGDLEINSKLRSNTDDLFDLRQRNYAKDYFTTATTDPQAGIAASVQFTIENEWNFEGGANFPSAHGEQGEAVPGDTIGSGQFTIAALRAANSLQRFLERHNIAGDRYPDRILADWGCLPSDAITDRAIYLGQVKNNVICHSVVSGISQAGSTGVTSNPFYKSAGSTAGRMTGFNQGHLASFHAKEHGLLVVMMSLYPHAYYGSGVRRFLQADSCRKSLADFPNALLCGVGDQPIYPAELNGNNYFGESGGTFGYTQRFAEVKFLEDTVNGLMIDGQNLDNFALKRSFGNVSGPQLNSSFLEIPTTCLDEVLAVSTDISNYGYKYDAGFSYKKSTCLPAYCIPTLDSEHDVHTLMIDNGGRRL